MSTIELIAWAGLAVGFAGAFGIFATSTGLRRWGSLAMSAGLTVFGTTGLIALMSPALGGNPFALILTGSTVVAVAIIASRLTRFFYRVLDLDLDGIETSYRTDIT